MTIKEALAARQTGGAAPTNATQELILVPNEIEAIFCLALLTRTDTRVTQSVLEKYLALKGDALNVLKALGMRT